MIESNQIDLWFIPFRKLTCKKYIKNLLDEQELTRGNSFKYDILKERYFYYHFAFRNILSKYMDIHPKEIKYTYTQNNKPYIKGSSYHFNFSHSQDIAFLGIQRDSSIGVDIEVIKSNLSFYSISQIFYSKKELKEWQTLPQLQKTNVFYQIWTAKEAYGKLKGVGLNYPLTKVTIPRIKEKDKLQSFSGIEGEYCSLYQSTFSKDGIPYMYSVAIPFQKISCKIEIYEE